MLTQDEAEEIRLRMNDGYQNKIAPLTAKELAIAAAADKINNIKLDHHKSMARELTQYRNRIYMAAPREPWQVLHDEILGGLEEFGMRVIPRTTLWANIERVANEAAKPFLSLKSPGAARRQAREAAIDVISQLRREFSSIFK